MTISQNFIYRYHFSLKSYCRKPFGGSLNPLGWLGLTLPVQRYLVPIPSTKGGEPTPPMISKTVDPTNFNFGRTLGLSMRGKKRVELMIQVLLGFYVNCFA